MAKSSLKTGSRTVYDLWSGSSKGSYSLQWYDLSDYLSIGIAWSASSNDTSVSIAPKVCRWDSNPTDNYGGTFSESLSPDPTGSGSWSGLSWNCKNEGCSGWSGWYDTFSTRTYNKTHSTQTVTLKITSYDLYTWKTGYYGSDTSTFTYTVPALASYSVTYNANGGSGAPSAQTKWYNETLSLSSTKPTRSGYVFLGWSTNKDATSATYSAGGDYTSNSAATLYAIWREARVTVNYHINGGTLTAQATSGATAIVYRHSNNIVQYYNPTATTPAWATLGTNISLTATYANLYNVATFPITRAGHHIVASSAWNLNAAGTSTDFHQADTAENTVNKVTTTRLNGGTQISSDVTKTLYVKWVPDTYTISYNANGGSGAPNSQTKTYNIATTLSSTIPTKANTTNNIIITFNANNGTVSPTSATSVKTIPQNFSGWNTNSAGTGTTYAAGATYTANESVTLYAKWTDGTVTYSSVILATGTRTNHTLLGWYTSSATTGGTKRGNGGATYTPTQAETLYARWGYNITYNANNGDTTPTAQVKTPGTTLTLAPAITRNKNVTTYTTVFDPNGGSVTPTSRQATKTIQHSFTHWKATNNTTYAANGSYTADEPTVMTAQWNTTTSTTSITLPTPTWTGRVMDGWYTNTSWTTKRGNAGITYTPTQSETLYARWQRSVTYNKNTSSTISNLPATQTAYTDTAIQISNTVPTWTSHNFYKWNTAADGSGTWYEPGQIYSDTNSLNLYAIWKYTITYDANGGTDAPFPHTQIVGQNIRIADEPIYPGYKFVNWTTNANGTGTVYNKGQVYTGTQQNLNLYAQWIKINTVQNIEQTDVTGGNRFASLPSILNIWNKIAQYFYGKTLYSFNGTIDWNIIRTAPTEDDLVVNLSEDCGNYKRLLIVGKTYHNTYITTTITNPQRNKEFILEDSSIFHDLNLTPPEPFTLHMRFVPWTISNDGTKIEQQGVYGQYYLKDNTVGWQNNFYIKIIKVIGYKN